MLRIFLTTFAIAAGLAAQSGFPETSQPARLDQAKPEVMTIADTPAYPAIERPCSDAKSA